MVRRAIISLLGVLAFLLAGGTLGWVAGPLEAVWAVRSLSDPAKLATLGHRGANPRLNKIVFWLAQARDRGMEPATALQLSQLLNGELEAPARLRATNLLRNLKIADELGLLTPENQSCLRSGKAATITQGPYRGNLAEVDHIVPVSLVPEVGNELANLELMPAPLNRQKSARVGPRQLAHAEAMEAAGLLKSGTLPRVRSVAKPR
jgi:hypothetical protein